MVVPEPDTPRIVAVPNIMPITLREGKAHIGSGQCIRCFCCQEMCPVKAIDIRKFFGFRM